MSIFKRIQLRLWRKRFNPKRLTVDDFEYRKLTHMMKVSKENPKGFYSTKPTT